MKTLSNLSFILVYYLYPTLMIYTLVKHYLKNKTHSFHKLYMYFLWPHWNVKNLKNIQNFDFYQ